jgi:hypothetical protein
MCTGFKSYHKCVVAIHMGFSIVPLKTNAFSRMSCHSDVKTHAQSNTKRHNHLQKLPKTIKTYAPVHKI